MRMAVTRSEEEPRSFRSTVVVILYVWPGTTVAVVVADGLPGAPVVAVVPELYATTIVVPAATGSKVKRATAFIGVRPATVFSREHSHVVVSQSQSHEWPVMSTSSDTVAADGVK